MEVVKDVCSTWEENTERENEIPSKLQQSQFESTKNRHPTAQELAVLYAIERGYKNGRKHRLAALTIMVPVDFNQMPMDFTQDVNEMELTGDAQGGTRQRPLPSLISAKRAEAERIIDQPRRTQMISGDAKWAAIEQVMADNGHMQNAMQCRKQWERLNTEWKKVYDFEKKKPSGHPPYFQQTNVERKEWNLPPAFQEDWYMALVCWLPNHRGVNPREDQVLDASAPGFGAPPLGPDHGGSPSMVGDNNTTTPNSPTESYEHNGSPDDTIILEQTGRTRASASTDFDAMGKRKKKGKKGSRMEMSDALKEWMETISEETKRLHDMEMLLHTDSTNLMTEANAIHREALAQDRLATMQLTGAIDNVGRALGRLVDHIGGGL